MDIRLSAEQHALADSAAQVVRDLGAGAVGQLDDLERAAKLDAAVAAAGWRELRSADENGDPWASGVEVALVAEQLGQGPADAAFLGPTVAAELRRRAGAPAATEPETVLMTRDLGRVAVAPDGAVPEDAIAIDSAGATSALILIPIDGDWSLAAAPLAGATTTTDLTRPVARPAATSATPIDAQTATLNDDALGRATALGLATTCADLVGAMQGAVDLAADYAGQRRQYGQPVGSFQAVQHMLADAFVLTEGSRSLARYAAWAVDALTSGDALVAASAAKAYAARSARDVCEISIQVHGGIGNTWECRAHVFLRRVLLSSDAFGGIDASLDRVLAGHGIGGDAT